jgi:hypothetical protein
VFSNCRFLAAGLLLALPLSPDKQRRGQEGAKKAEGKNEDKI